MRKSWIAKLSVLCAAAIMLSSGNAFAATINFNNLLDKVKVTQDSDNNSDSGNVINQADDATETVTVREPLTRGPAKKNVVNLDNPVKSTTMESFYLDLTVVPSTGEWYIREKTSSNRGGQIWTSGEKGFGEITYQIDDKVFTTELKDCEVKNYEKGLLLTFHPVPNIADMNLLILATPVETQPAIKFTIHPAKQLNIVSLKIFDDALPITSEDANGGVLIPVREGILVPANSGKAFEREFGDSVYEGCHVRFWGLMKNNTGAFITWDDPYTVLGIKSIVDKQGKQTLSTSLTQKKNPGGFTLYFSGKGDFNEMTRDYLDSFAKKNGTYVPWSKKTAENKSRKALFGATNFKLWSVLDRRMDEASQKEVSVKVNWTFEEAGKVAEHLKNDLEMDNVLFTMGGWIHRGYDNQHPDILPAAPECGGNWGLRKAVWTIQNAGYTACLHDNYQDMYKDAPSWDEKYLSKNLDGSIKPGGVWAGGRPYLTCSKASLELASRPRNLPEVLKITQARSYFIDTTYAGGLEECYDKAHPIDFEGDIYWRCKLSDYARGVFGIFGSEDGREWAIPHADFFEGITGVSGKDFHTFNVEDLGATFLPLFEMIYHDCIAAYGKYGYDINKSAAFVLRHIALGRPLYHHSVPTHLYWENYTAPENQEVAPEAIYTSAKQGWGEGKHPFDVFVKNTHEILSPLNKITAEMQLVRFDYLNPEKTVTRSVFQGGGKTVLATVNYGTEPYRSVSITKKDFVIPQYGFVIESTDFIAFNASLYNDVEYSEPVLFTLQSQDGQPVWNSKSVRVFHGFGPSNIRVGASEFTVPQQSVINTTGSAKADKATKAADKKKEDPAAAEPAPEETKVAPAA